MPRLSQHAIVTCRLNCFERINHLVFQPICLPFAADSPQDHHREMHIIKRAMQLNIRSHCCGGLEFVLPDALLQVLGLPNVGPAGGHAADVVHGEPAGAKSRMGVDLSVYWEQAWGIGDE
jgi:hypothetical protein